MKRPSPKALLLLLLLFGAACGGSNNPVAPVTPPTPPPVPTVTETFAGQLDLGDTSCHFFEVAQIGAAEMSITALAPLETLTLGLGVGLPNEEAETGCTLVVTDRSVRKGETFLATLGVVGTNCVCVFDVGNIFEGFTVTYSIDIEHP
jgi:hypothetical protein